MESSHVVRQCLKQAGRSRSSWQYLLASHRGTACYGRSRSGQFLSREFSSTSYRTEGNPETATTAQGSPNTHTQQPRTANSIRSSGRSSSQTDSRPPQYDQGRRPYRYPSDADRIDLSTIPGMPSSYRPPNRPDEASAQAKLRSLLGAVAQKNNAAGSPATEQQQQQSSRRLGREASEAEIDDIFPLSGLSAYASRNSNTQSRRGRGEAGGSTTPAPATFDIADLIADIDKPRRTPLDFLSGTNTLDQPEVLRLSSSLGRTVSVTPATGFDLTRAFRTLDVRCNQNGVRRDEIKQRFYVRKGQAKKIARRQRWRVVFKEGFLAECARIRRMRAQGW